MFCSNCGKKLKNEEKKCPKCGHMILENAENVSNNSKNNEKIKIGLKGLLVLIFIFMILIGIIIYGIIYILSGNKVKTIDDEKNIQISTEQSIDVGNSVSFKNMQVDDENLNEIQQEILKYFGDTTECFSASPENLQRYPQIFEQSKISLSAGVVKVLKSTNDELEVLVYEDPFGYNFGPNQTADKYVLGQSPTDRLCIIKGKQLEERVIEYDWVGITGRYLGVETRVIDGVSYTLPVIQLIDMGTISYDIDSDDSSEYKKTIRTVAKYIFGDDIKITKTNSEKKAEYDIYGEFQGYSYTPEYYLVTLDNQTNSNFKAFNMPWGTIEYNKEQNNLTENITKKLFCSADFNHFIVTTYDSNLKVLYIDYFDKSFNKIWSREFDYNSNYINNIKPMDYNNDQMALVIDNDLYLLDLKTGENIFEPVIVGFKTKVIMMEDGIILIGEENKDLVIKVDFKGNILYRLDGDTELTKITTVTSQIVNNNLVLYVHGENENYTGENIDEYDIEKYIVLKPDGSIEYSTKDLGGYRD